MTATGLLQIFGYVSLVFGEVALENRQGFSKAAKVATIKQNGKTRLRIEAIAGDAEGI